MIPHMKMKKALSLPRNLKLGYPPESAVDLAVERCLKEKILEDVLRANRKEVTNMFLEEYDEELHHKVLKKEGFDSGYSSGYDTAIKETQKRINALAQRLREDDRTEDFFRSTTDPEYQKKLLIEYGLYPAEKNPSTK